MNTTSFYAFRYKLYTRASPGPFKWEGNSIAFVGILILRMGLASTFGAHMAHVFVWVLILSMDMQKWVPLSWTWFKWAYNGWGSRALLPLVGDIEDGLDTFLEPNFYVLT